MQTSFSKANERVLRYVQQNAAPSVIPDPQHAELTIGVLENDEAIAMTLLPPAPQQFPETAVKSSVIIPLSSFVVRKVKQRLDRLPDDAPSDIFDNVHTCISQHLGQVLLDDWESEGWDIPLLSFGYGGVVGANDPTGIAKVDTHSWAYLQILVIFWIFLDLIEPRWMHESTDNDPFFGLFQDDLSIDDSLDGQSADQSQVEDVTFSLRSFYYRAKTLWLNDQQPTASLDLAIYVLGTNRLDMGIVQETRLGGRYILDGTQSVLDVAARFLPSSTLLDLLILPVSSRRYILLIFDKNDAFWAAKPLLFRLERKFKVRFICLVTGPGPTKFDAAIVQHFVSQLDVEYVASISDVDKAGDIINFVRNLTGLQISVLFLNATDRLNTEGWVKENLARWAQRNPPNPFLQSYCGSCANVAERGIRQRGLKACIEAGGTEYSNNIYHLDALVRFVRAAAIGAPTRKVGRDRGWTTPEVPGAGTKQLHRGLFKYFQSLQEPYQLRGVAKLKVDAII